MILDKIKEAGQDFEWYPTTDKIIDIIANNIDKERIYQERSIIDIGAGDGRVLKRIQEKTKEYFKLYAIEKSQILINEMDKNIFIIGTDFYQQSLVDKEASILFCNPPYSDYEYWTTKIIKEAYVKCIYLVIPERWENNKKILSEIENKKYKYEVIGKANFLNAERAARANVHIVKIDTNHRQDSVFANWFDEHFKIEIKDDDKTKKEPQIKNELLNKSDLINELEKLYNRDFKKLLDTFKMFENIDYSLLKEVGIDKSKIQGSLSTKIKKLKMLYWKELFDNLDVITSRLTEKSRSSLLGTLNQNTHVDFTASNAYSIIIWAIKNANNYFDNQLLDLYYDLSCKENVKLYKSNHNMINDRWRYCRREATHYLLDYRIVHNFYNTFNGYSFDLVNGLNFKAHDFIGDIITIAKNLGFEFSSNISSKNYHWEPRKKIELFYKDGSVFAEIRAYMNGNLHFKFEQKFMRKLNVEAGRLNGWVKSPENASDEMGLSKEEINDYWKVNKNFELSNGLKLIGGN